MFSKNCYCYINLIFFIFFIFFRTKKIKNVFPIFLVFVFYNRKEFKKTVTCLTIFPQFLWPSSMVQAVGPRNCRLPIQFEPIPSSYEILNQPNWPGPYSHP